MHSSSLVTGYLDSRDRFKLFASGRLLEVSILKHEITVEERALFDDASAHAALLWELSKNLEGMSDDPKMFSVMLFKRLWSNHRGYALLWKAGLQLESDIILRSGIEASICLAANFELRGDFIAMLKGDAMFTVKGQVKLHRDEGSWDLVRESEAVLRHLQSHLPPGTKTCRLDWRQLAELGRVPQLYGWHRMLSGTSSHITGASILTDIEPVHGPNPAAELRPFQRRMHFMMMAGATLQGALRHGGMIENDESLEETVALLTRLADLSSGLSSD